MASKAKKIGPFLKQSADIDRVLADKTGPPIHGLEKDKEILLKSVKNLLGERAFYAGSSSGKNVDTYYRLTKIVQAGAPPMKIISLRTLETLSTFPHSAMNLTVDARDALTLCGSRWDDAGFAVICFLSHRWLRPEIYHPDDESSSKLKAVIEFGRWLEWVITNGKDVDFDQFPNCYVGGKDGDPDFKGDEKKNVRLFFWIDFACVDQNPDQLAFYINSLPLYIACCNYMVCCETDEYNDRAWCRLEQAMAYSFMRSGQSLFSIDLNFQHKMQTTLIGKHSGVRDPRQGQLTAQSDMQCIEELVLLADHSNTFTYSVELARHTLFFCGPCSSKCSCLMNVCWATTMLGTLWCFGTQFFLISSRKHILKAIDDADSKLFSILQPISKGEIVQHSSLQPQGEQFPNTLSVVPLSEIPASDVVERF